MNRDADRVVDPALDGMFRADIPALLRRVVAIAIAIGCPTMLVLTFVLGPDDPLVLWGYPPIVGYLVVYAWVLVRRPQQALAFSRTTLVVFETAWIVWGWSRLAGAEDVRQTWHGLFPTYFLGLIVFLIVSGLVMTSRGALVHAAVVLTGVLVTGLGALVGRRDVGDVAVDVVRYVVFLVVIVLLLQVLAQAKARLAVAEEAARRASEEAGHMRDIAYLDALTGLANRRRLLEELAERSQQVSPQNPVALVYFDLDHFKEVNDTYGHGVGDQVLCLVARAASRVVRQHDLVARVGGEEFVVVAPGTDRDRAVQLAERLRAVLPQEVGEALGLQITGSFGVVLLEPAEPPLAALDRVDALMYDAKTSGRDRVISPG
ncbi:GGDEF domain-containing protein [Cellulomonas sp. APG4]|uniref:GGDEF domain-containing protein n=1 Tax=Cellulomonas sp. APG4 TaxID=1538656 RepID=UPI00137B4A3E|nr:GGDEF domain-containing protein [Cellulomonas sp. APG4]